MGYWTIGGALFSGEGCHYPTGRAVGYGKVDDEQSIKTIHTAIESGINLFDTADKYGAGHGESVLGNALKNKRNDVVISTKVGHTFDSESLENTGTNITPSYIESACMQSLKRLQTDWIDLYFLHVDGVEDTAAIAVFETMERLCERGLIRYFGWSTDSAESCKIIKDFPHGVAIQHDINIFQDTPDIIKLCESEGLTSINRCPLAMGFLTGNFPKLAH